MDIKDAIIDENGELFCSCGKPLAGVREYELVMYDGIKLFQFLRHCSGKKCWIVSQYCIDLTIDNRKVLILPYKECKKIKDDNKQIKKEGEE